MLIMNNNISNEIKNRLTMRDVLRLYTNCDDTKSRIPCPIHNGTHPNFSYGDKYFKCFKCGVSGDVITFTMKCLGLDFNTAMQRLNDDFKLNLLKSRKEYLRRDMMKALQQKREQEAKRNQIEMEKRRVEENYWSAFDLWKMYDDNRRIYKPKAIGEEFHPKYIEAVKNIDYAEYKLNIADMERDEFYKCQMKK